MTLEDLKKLPLLQTRSIAAVLTDDETLSYIARCLERFFNGDYGDLTQDDIDANNYDLKCGCGHVLARYKQSGKLEDDIYIESHFDSDYLNDINYSQTMVMYTMER